LTAELAKVWGWGRAEAVDQTGTELRFWLEQWNRLAARDRTE
jgi:hypothetical protein